MLTSYFVKSDKLEGRRLVSIARGTPDWFVGEKLIELAPSWELIGIAKMGDLKTYREKYYEEVLDKLSARYIYRCYSDAVFMCHEARPPYWAPKEMYFQKPYFCHRHIVADWFRMHGLICEEARV